MLLERQPPAKIAVLAILLLGIVFCIAACQEAAKLRDLQADARKARPLECSRAAPDLGRWVIRDAMRGDGS